MKIYIAKKEDTFWKIAKENEVDMDRLIHANPQISTPDMMLSGMKIKIPQKRKQVKSKEEKSPQRNVEKQVDEQARQIPVIEADDDKWKTVQPTLPYTMIQEKKKYPLEVEEQPKSEPSKRGTNTKNVSSNNHASQKLRFNPISIIRNLPHENIPEVNVLQVSP